MTAPVALARPAATVVLARDGEHGVEVYLLRRPLASSFAARAHVFPGGRVDPEDGDDAMLAHASRLDVAAVAARMRLPADEGGRRTCVAHHVAAVREAFEEAGVLLGTRVGGGTLGRAGAPALQRAREQLLAGTPFAAVLEGGGLRLTPERLHYIAHFTTPESEPRRYDTRFFLARTPGDQDAAVHPAEATEGGWWPAAEVLAHHGHDRTALMPPTRIVCTEVAAHATVDAAIADLGARPVSEVLFAPGQLADGALPERLPPAPSPR